MPNGDPLLIGRPDNNATQESRLTRNDDGTSQSGLTVQQGPNASGPGIAGISHDAEGVRGESTDAAGVHGASANDVGVFGESSGSAGVVGYSTSTVPGEQDGVGGASLNGPGVSGASNKDVGVYGYGFSSPGVAGYCSSQPGVVGSSSKNCGVYGDAPTLGVRGVASSRFEFGTGVAGTCLEGDGVYGESTNQGYGVHGKSPWGAGVYGEDIAQYAGGQGVYGTSDNGWGVRGESGGYTGVYGQGRGSAHGVWGTAVGSPTAWTPAGVYGGANKGPGVFAETDLGEFGLIAVSSTILAAGGFSCRNSGHRRGAAAFGGDVSVSGGLYVEGPLKVFGDPKSAVVRLPDGSHRLLYCMESPESWFEDFGRGRLVRGRGKVTLDRTFAAVVRIEDYHVFLSPEGESGGIYVRGRTRTGFEVREQGGGRSTLPFSYRIVARRKDVTAPRFKKETLHPIRLRRPKAVSTPKAAKLPKRLKRPILPKIGTNVRKRTVPPKLLERFALRSARGR